MADESSRRARSSPCCRSFYCVAESFDRKKLEELLRMTYPPQAVGLPSATSSTSSTGFSTALS